MGIPSGDDKVLGESIVQNTTVSPAAMRVIRLHELPAFLGVRRSQINEAVRAGWLHPFTPIPGGRGKVVTEAEVIALQQRAMAEVYDGRTFLGSLRRCGVAHEARDASGRVLGVFPDAKAAAAAVSDSYNANADFAGSLDDCYCAVRARIAAGGKGWEPK